MNCRPNVFIKEQLMQCTDKCILYSVVFVTILYKQTNKSHSEVHNYLEIDAISVLFSILRNFVIPGHIFLEKGDSERVFLL